ncbi:hypothetical protein [Poseidonocella sp. HB161398]|uniref:hypothetical protein n=1 Tax=Poseidonocella sp. HB161398 TaxID=2320855 RepID=UPI0011084A57|nr:hypothetical protein [Poseidonocella sp. HB161398]
MLRGLALLCAQGAAASATTLFDGSGKTASFTARLPKRTPLAGLTVETGILVQQFSQAIDLLANDDVNFIVFETGTLI